MIDGDTPDLERPLGSVEANADEPEPDGLELDERQIEEMRGIFASSLPQYLGPLEELCNQLLSGGGEEVLASFRATVESLREAADKMSFAAVSELLLRLENAVAQLPLDPSQPAGRDERELVLGLVLDLRQVSDELGTPHVEIKGRPLVERLAGMPDAAGFAAQLARAGLVLDSQLTDSRPDEIAAVSGLDRAQVARVLAWLAGEPEPACQPPSPGDDARARSTPGGAEADGATPPVTPPRGAPRPAERAAAVGAAGLDPAEEVAALGAATERLGARLAEVRDDIGSGRARIEAQRAECKRLVAELEHQRKANGEYERWLATATDLRARLLSQRELYATAQREVEQRLGRRRQQLADLTSTTRTQRDELGGSREALEELDTMVRGIRSRLARERGKK